MVVGATRECDSNGKARPSMPKLNGQSNVNDSERSNPPVSPSTIHPPSVDFIPNDQLNEKWIESIEQEKDKKERFHVGAVAT